MSKKKKKYYTVWKGHCTGVFETWNECKAQIKDFQGAQYKSFATFNAAKKALKGNYFDYV
jgi:ribonuclease HI